MDAAEDLQKKVDGSPRSKGLALIVGCEEGPKTEKKTYSFLAGVKKDVDLMEETFRDTLRYCTWRIMNPTQVELEAALRAVAMYPDYPPSYKRFVFIFAGHGLNEQIVVKDGFVRITENVIVPLEAKNACSLATVPKLFFIDACRGPLQDNGVIVASRGGEVVESIKVPEKGNMLIAYSTLPHYEALEDSSSGGLWLKTLASELRNSNDSITDVLTTVRKKVLYQCMHLRTKDGAPIHQVSQSDDTLFEKVCFLTEAESREEGEAMDTSDTRAVAASGGVVVPLSLFNGHSSVSPASSTLRQGQSGTWTFCRQYFLHFVFLA